MIENFDSKEYEFLSNFYYCDVEYENVMYPSVEHAYQSAKSKDKSWRTKCASKSYYPGQIKNMSKHIKLVDGWNNKKLEVMESCVRNKFNKDPLRCMLINTGDQYIKEGNKWGDKFWGVCLEDGEGKNNMGIILMKIREEISFEPIW